MDHYRIRNWNTLFENNRSRELKRLEWVLVPNRMDSFEYGTLVNHPNGAAHLGAWLSILLAASRQEPRGDLPQGGAGLSQVLAVMSRLPVTLFDEVLPRLVNLQWIEQVATLPQGGAGNWHASSENGFEGKGREGKGTELKGNTAVDSEVTKPPTSQELRNEVKNLAAMKSMTNPTEERRGICRQLLMAYPEANGLPGEPDSMILAKCLSLASDSTEDLGAALRSMWLAHKKPESSWAWFPVVLEQYLQPRREIQRERRA